MQIIKNYIRPTLYKMFPLVALEGPNNVGKSTILNGISLNVGKFHFPNYESPVGQLIKDMLQNDGSDFSLDECQALDLLFAADRCLCKTKLQAELKIRPVVLDRYIYSGLAYSHARRALINQDVNLVDLDYYNLKPDVVILVLGRGFNVKNPTLQTSVTAAFLKLYKELGSKWHVINTDECSPSAAINTCQDIIKTFSSPPI